MIKRGLSNSKVIFIFLFAVAFLSFVSAAHPVYSTFAEASFSINNNVLSISDDIIYNTGYYSINGASWQQFTLQGTPYGGGHPWILSDGVGDLDGALDEEGTHYIIVYSCSLDNNAWDCHENTFDNAPAKWQLTIITNGDPGCIPNCQGKVCGIDGCGGSCGSCPSSRPRCSNGQCISYESEPLNLGVEPYGYLTVGEIQALLRDWSAAEPDMLSYEVYGQTGGYDLVALRISAVDSYVEQNTPKALINSCIHGDEWIATASSLVAFHRLLSDYGSDDRVTAMFSNRVVYYIPVVNPVGYNAREREEEGRDPNRAFPHSRNPDNQPTSSVALITFFEQKEFNAAISVHADGRMVLTPLDNSHELYDNTGAGDAHRTVASHMAEEVGWQWGKGVDLLGYPARGTAGEFFFFRGHELGFNTLSLGLEVGTMQRPPTSEISEEADYLVDILTIFIEEAPVIISNA